jgi:CBS domain-containing protein
MRSTLWTRVRDVATREPVVIRPQTSLRVASEVMSAHSVGALVVATGRGAVGILSERDIVTALAVGADPNQATVAGAMSYDLVSVRDLLRPLLTASFEHGV